VLIVFSLCRESLKLTLVDEPLSLRWFYHTRVAAARPTHIGENGRVTVGAWLLVARWCDCLPAMVEEGEKSGMKQGGHSLMHGWLRGGSTMEGIGGGSFELIGAMNKARRRRKRVGEGYGGWRQRCGTFL
jgi:hypothetical protein